MDRQKYSVHRVPYSLQFQASAGGLGKYPQWISRDYCTALGNRFTAVHIEHNTIINNNTRINFPTLTTVNLFLPYPVSMLL